MKGRKVLIIDDVITAGTAIREAVTMLRNAEAQIVGTVVCLDRQERASEESASSAIQQVEMEYGFPVISIIQLVHLISFISNRNDAHRGDEESIKLLEAINRYRQQYGI